MYDHSYDSETSNRGEHHSSSSYTKETERHASPLWTGFLWFFWSWVTLFMLGFLVKLDITAQAIVTGIMAFAIGFLAGYIADRFSSERRMLRTHREVNNQFSKTKMNYSEIRHVSDLHHKHMKQGIALFFSLCGNALLITIILFLLTRIK